MVYCGVCRRRLLSPKSEYTRQTGTYKKRVQRMLPPKAYPHEGRWSCVECLLKDKGVIS